MRHLYVLALALVFALALASGVLGGLDSVETKPLADRADKPSSDERLRDLQDELDSMREDVEDLYEPVEEFYLFDECMFTIGVTQYGEQDGTSGYVYGKEGRKRQQALAMDMRGFDPPQYDFLAFPGEEPPQIECNEDAGGRETDE